MSAVLTPERSKMLSAAGTRGGKARKHRWTEEEMET